MYCLTEWRSESQATVGTPSHREEIRRGVMTAHLIALITAVIVGH